MPSFRSEGGFAVGRSLHAGTVTKWTPNVTRQRTDSTPKWLLNERAAIGLLLSCRWAARQWLRETFIGHGNNPRGIERPYQSSSSS